MHKGIAVSPGVVVGVAYRVDSVFGASEPETLADPVLIPAEIERFERALSATAAEIEVMVAKVQQQLGHAEADIFKSHIQIVNDPTLLTKVHTLLGVHHRSAMSAPQSVFQGYAAAFARIEQDYYRERLTDVRDVFSKIGSHLSTPLAERGRGHAEGEGPGPGEEPVILVAHE